MFRFRNLMIRDATYGSLLKRARAQMHERFVIWAERVNRERGREEEFEEIHGYHLEQAYRYRIELGPLDAAGREMGRRAATKLGNAGRRAFARSDIPAAERLVTRALALLEPTDVDAVRLQIELCDIHYELGNDAEGMAIARAAMEAADLLGRSAPRGACSPRWHGVPPLRGRRRRDLHRDEALQIALGHYAMFERDDDPLGMARALRRLTVSIHHLAGRYDQAAMASQQVVASPSSRRAPAGLPHGQWVRIAGASGHDTRTGDPANL